MNDLNCSKKLKILVICQHYQPEPYKLSDICEALVAKGHEVTVVTGVPNYPYGYIYADYKKGQRRVEDINGVQVYRSFTIGRRKGMLFRLINYYSFAWSSSLNVLLNRYKAADGSDFDVVFANQTSPVLMASAAVAYKKKYKKNLVMYCMDLWPASLTAGGINSGHPIYKFFHRVSKKIYRAADTMLISSKSFEEYLISEFDLDKETIHYQPQYAEEVFTGQQTSVEDKETIDLMFAGNVGKAQDLGTVLEAAKLLQAGDDCERKVQFHIVGAGSELSFLKGFSQRNKLENVHFYGKKPVEDMPNYYAMADAMLVTLKGGTPISSTLPAKVQSYMAAGKTIIGAIDGDTEEVIDHACCGAVGSASDVTALVENIRRFCHLSLEDRAQLGRNARAYYEKHFTKQRFIDDLERYLELVSNR